MPEILLLLLGATLAGADDLVEIELGGQQQLRFLRRFRPDTYGIPSHDPLGAVLGAPTRRCSRPASPLGPKAGARRNPS